MTTLDPRPPSEPVSRRSRRRLGLPPLLRPVARMGRRAVHGIPLDQIFAIVRTSGSMVASLLLNSGLGFIFWWVAARGFTTADVGLAAAAIAAMGLLTRFASIGIGTALAGALAERRQDPARLLIPGLLTAAGIAGALGLAFALIAPRFAPALAPLAADPFVSIGFGMAVALTAIGFVFDQASIGLLRGGPQLVRNVVFAVGKLVLLVAAVATGYVGGMVIVAVWVMGEVLSFVALGAILPRHRIAQSGADWRALGNLGWEAGGHHLLNLSRYAPSLAMPLIVTALFSPADNGIFYIAYLLAGAAQLVSASATLTLYAAARRNPDDLAGQIRLTLILSIGGVLAAVTALWLAGPMLLGIFGAAYAEDASSLLPLLALLAVPLIVKDHWIALTRIHSRIYRGAALTSLAAIAEFAGAVVGASIAGLDGLAVGWLAVLVAISALQVPTVLRATRKARSVNP